MKDKHITDIRICSKCGTVSIAGNEKCPNCGADEHSGWNKTEIRLNTKTRAEIIKKRFKNTFSFASQLWRNYWKPIIAMITAAAFVSLFIPAKNFRLFLYASILALVVYFIYRYIFKRQETENKRLYLRLLNMAQGDKDLVSRMIENEHRRNPDGNVEEWLSDAIDCWQREMR
jgi:RNA polymerase subunit RPABC4/transcription elongation factor Spt4